MGAGFGAIEVEEVSSMYPNRPHGLCGASYIIHLLEINTRISVEELCQTFNLALPFGKSSPSWRSRAF